MAFFIERRRPIWHSAITLAVIFSAGVVVALVFDGVPTLQNHGQHAGPGLVRRATEPGMYYWLTTSYAGIAVVSWTLAFFRFPWFTVNHVRLMLLGLFLLLGAFVVWNLMLAGGDRERELAAWKRIEALGGHGVWEPDLVVVSLAKTRVTDDDLELFRDFRHVQMLDLSDTAVTEKGLELLNHLDELHTLILVRTAIGRDAIEQFRKAHPTVDLQTEPTPKGAIVPGNGESHD